MRRYFWYTLAASIMGLTSSIYAIPVVGEYVVSTFPVSYSSEDIYLRRDVFSDSNIYIVDLSGGVE